MGKLSSSSGSFWATPGAPYSEGNGGVKSLALHRGGIGSFSSSGLEKPNSGAAHTPNSQALC